MENKAIKSDQFWPFLYRKIWNLAGRSRWMSFGLRALWDMQNGIEKVLKWRNFAQKSYRPLKFCKFWKKIKTPLRRSKCEFRTSAKLIRRLSPQPSRPRSFLASQCQKFVFNQSIQFLHFFQLYFPPPYLASKVLLCTANLQVFLPPPVSLFDP